MHRRAFLVSLTGLAAAPDPQTVGGFGSTGGAASDGFDAWVSGFRARALGRGLPSSVVEPALAGLQPDPRVLALDSRQPEFSKPVSDYLASTVSEGRIAAGRAKLEAVSPRLGSIGARGAPREILAAIWGVESGFGTVQGDYDVIRSLATQAAQGRRAAWAESQLMSALRILQRGEADRATLKGSWAGAMGQTQFTPEDFLNFAVDGDGDGRRDIWRSDVDALASSANFLDRKAAWRTGQSWAREVTVPREGFEWSRVEVQALSPDDWGRLGVRPADGRGFRPADRDSSATLILPMGWRGPGFLAFPNHLAIRAYNNSTSYALAVGFLADRIAGGGPLVQPWPADGPTSLADRVGAQTALQRLGFDPGGVDGVIGTGTRRAARAWQAARGLPADGYLSGDLMRRLRAEAQV